VLDGQFSAGGAETAGSIDIVLYWWVSRKYPCKVCSEPVRTQTEPLRTSPLLNPWSRFGFGFEQEGNIFYGPGPSSLGGARTTERAY
jgi:hypothetical protein